MHDPSPTWGTGALTRAFRCIGLVFLATWPLVRASDGAEPGLTERIAGEETAKETRVVGLARARVSHPQKLSGALGAIVSRHHADYDCRTVCEFRGFLMQAEPGLGGGQISAGYAIVNGMMGPGADFLSHVYIGYGIKGALLRSWGRSSLDPEDQTLLGVEGEMTFIGVNFSLGVFRHVGSGDPNDPWVVAGGVGWGF